MHTKCPDLYFICFGLFAIAKQKYYNISMDIIELINKKKQGKKISKQEWDFFVKGVCDGKIKDYQTTSFLMAICLKSIDFDETAHLTMAMAKSGQMLNLSDIGRCVDKHSTGGVSDTTTLVVVPTLASLGVKVAKMSGRSLGWTGGTADKMEVFDGYKTDIDTKQFKNLIRQNGASIVSQSKDFALADKIIYKLRSDSGTTDNIGLIASSIMSKKIACGAKIILLDVKYGSGAFMKTFKDAKQLAQTMVQIGRRAGVKVCAVISSMQQPLTNYIGNNLEVYSALEVLDGKQNDLFDLSTFLCAKALVLDGVCKNFEQASQMAKDAIKSGKSKQKLRQIVMAQGGDVSKIDNPNLLLPKNNMFVVTAQKDGYVAKIDTAKLGYLAHDLQKVDGEVVRQDDTGIILSKRLGDEVKAGEPLMRVFYNKLDNLDEIKAELLKTYTIGKKVNLPKLIDKVVE